MDPDENDKPQDPPAPEPAPEPTPEPAPAPDDKAKPDARKIDDLPAWAQAELRRARMEAVNARKAAEEQKTEQGPSPEDLVAQAQKDLAQQIGKALGLVAEEEKSLDPQQVIEKLTAEKDSTAKERDAEKDRHRRALIELAVHRASTRLGADPDALLDSRSFLRNVRDMDPDGEGFSATLTGAIQKAVEDNPKFKAAGTSGPPAKSGGEFTGGPGARASDPEQMTTDDFRAFRRNKKSSD
ncbi:hypothetical protein [Nonomuraea endophytica]|uniref:DUF4355 domain-containing protein n=1 Tax=Nonomuraea endophytica TaxID=714136 RepID=A0A7W8EJ83_9ACTN|nr:hypothetical protein [Nonomuraea endophytica]MBB5081369.1 hypothetical protein [Nonomuraea endophytica]